MVTCTSDPSGLPVIVQNEASPETEGPTAPSIGIAVQVDAGASGVGTNRVEATGGGSPDIATNNQAVTMSAAEPPFGFAAFSSSLINEDGSPDTVAGSHPYSMITHFTLNNTLGRFGSQKPAGQGPKNLEVDLPLGFVGNPLATPRCPRALFNREQYVNYPQDCPPDTQVGYDVVAVESDSFRVAIPVYNLVPPPGVAAQFGFAFQKDIGFIDAGVRTGEGYGIKVTLHNVVQLGLIGNSLTLWGVPADASHNARRVCGSGSCPATSQARALLTNAGSCGEPQALTVHATSWLGDAFSGTFPITDNAERQTTLQGCEALGFAPSLTVRPDTTTADSPTGLDVDLHVPQTEGPAGLAQANLRDAVVALPGGVAVSPSAATGLEGCTLAQIGLGTSNPPSCPDASKVGTVEVLTPLLADPLKGAVYLAQQTANPFGSLVALYLSVEGSGVLIKLAGQVALDEHTGQLTTTFKDNPQLPFSDLKLHFFGGPRAALVTPPACGSYQTTSELTSWSSLVPATPSDAFSIAAGCQSGFTPSFIAGTTNNQAAAFSAFTVSLSRQDREQRLGSVTVATPPGALAVLKNVPRCGEPDAALGTCQSASLIGHTTVAAGPGSEPFTIGGSVYLTGPYKGAPFGLSIVTHAVAGPFDLGNVIVRAAVSVDPLTARVIVSADPLPLIRDGIPLDIRSVAVSIDRPGFMFNPTNCALLSVNGALGSSAGSSVPVSTSFEAANCNALAFRPGFSALTSAKTSKQRGASLHVRVTSGLGQAGIAKVHVALPKQLPSRLTTLQKACTAAVFNADPAHCPVGATVGTASVFTPLLAAPLTGPAYLVSHAAAAFPDLVLVLQGEGVTLELVGNTDIKHGVTTSTFKAVPDAPFSVFDLMLPQGRGSLLGGYGNICKRALIMPTTLTAQNGAVSRRNTRIAVSGCRVAHKHTHRARRGAR